VLNIELIARRRIALRLSRHDIARETGLSWQALLELEESDWRDGRHTLNTLYAVAWALGLTPSDLLEHNARQPGADSDAKIIGATLAASPDGLRDDVLARALGWPIQRVRDALAALTDQLPASGQTIRTIAGHHQLAPADTALDDQTLHAIARTTRPLTHDHLASSSSRSSAGPTATTAGSASHQPNTTCSSTCSSKARSSTPATPHAPRPTSAKPSASDTAPSSAISPAPADSRPAQSEPRRLTRR
jgi:transcriptional regulator with XRE-family HTH domain